MVKKKKQSKRLTLRKKYKIEKKVREHRRKKAKEGKKKETNQLKRKNIEAFPKLWPFKNELVNEYEKSKAVESDHKKQMSLRGIEKKEESKAGSLKLPIDGGKRKNVISSVSITSAMPEEDAIEMDTDRDAADGAREIKTPRDTTWKRFAGEVMRVVDLSDVILEVLDARDPLGTRCYEMERRALLQDGTKRVVLVLNKVDLVPVKVVKEWLAYFKNTELMPVIPFKSSTQEQRGKLQHIGRSKGLRDGIHTSACIGADSLLNLLKNYTKTRGVSFSITIGIVGYPNVGKSSIINSLARKRAVGTGGIAGVTTRMQYVHIDSKMRLLDSPGIVMDKKSDLGPLSGINAVDNPYAAVEKILERVSRDALLLFYKISEFDSVDEFLTLVGRRKGKLKKGGVVDTNAAIKSVLSDWAGGSFPFYAVPPEAKERGGAEIVSDWSKEFDIDSINETVLKELGTETDEATQLRERRFATATIVETKAEIALDSENHPMLLRKKKVGQFEEKQFMEAEVVMDNNSMKAAQELKSRYKKLRSLRRRGLLHPADVDEFRNDVEYVAQNVEGFEMSMIDFDLEGLLGEADMDDDTDIESEEEDTSDGSEIEEE